MSVDPFPNELVEAGGLVAVNAAIRWDDGEDAPQHSRVWAVNRPWIDAVFVPGVQAILPELERLAEQRVIDRLAREADGRAQRLRDAIHAADRELITIADFSVQEAADAIDSVRAGLKDALAETDVPAPDDARSVPDPVLCAACGGTGHRNGNRRAADPFGTCPGCDGTGKASRRIIVYDARAGRCGLTVPVGCTVGDAAWLAVAAMGVRVGPDDCPSLAVNGSGLHPANPLPDDLDFELVVIGGTV